MTEAEQIKMNNIVRVGTVSSVNAGERTARVEFMDRVEPFVSGPLTVLKNAPFIPEHTVSPWLPSVGEFVLCLFPPNGDGDGFVIGGF